MVNTRRVSAIKLDDERNRTCRDLRINMGEGMLESESHIQVLGYDELFRRSLAEALQSAKVGEGGRRIKLESLILAQNQRWRRASDMQVERLRLPSGSV